VDGLAATYREAALADEAMIIARMMTPLVTGNKGDSRLRY
jgi:hypothetical protein